jgi:hypothetical protein
MNRRTSHSPRSEASRFHPRLEALEDRNLLAASVTVQGSQLLIVGDAKANQIQIVDDGTKLTVTVGGKETTAKDITSIVVRSRQGNDTVNYSLTGELAGTRGVLIDLGNGGDTFTATLSGKVAAAGDLRIVALGGNGRDILRADGNGSDVADGGSLAVVFNGGNGNDLISGKFDLKLGGSLTFLGAGANGGDLVTADLTVDAGSKGKLRAEVLGGNGPDILAMTVDDNSGDDGDPLTTDKSTLGSAVLNLDGGRGKDFYRASEEVDVLRAERKF